MSWNTNLLELAASFPFWIEVITFHTGINTWFYKPLFSILKQVSLIQLSLSQSQLVINSKFHVEEYHISGHDFLFKLGSFYSWKLPHDRTLVRVVFWRIVITTPTEEFLGKMSAFEGGSRGNSFEKFWRNTQKKLYDLLPADWFGPVL